MKQTSTSRFRCPAGCTGSVAYCDLGKTLLSTIRLITHRLPNNVGTLMPSQMAPSVLWLLRQQNYLSDAYLVHVGIDDVLRRFEGGK